MPIIIIVGMSVNDRPTMPYLLNFPLTSGKRISLAIEIGKYRDFCIQLLHDERGNQCGQISDGVGPNPEHILIEVFERWLNGSGKPVKTWKTIIQVLKDVKMLTLAKDLESALME